MAEQLSGKTALVTGASRGIGEGIAKTLAAQGALVAVHYAAKRDHADRVAADIERAGGKAFVLQADLADPAQIPALFTKLDEALIARTGARTLDILVNNAGRGGGGGFLNATPADFDLVFDLNVKGLFFCCQEAIPRLRDGGRVINIGSMTYRGASVGSPLYAASKVAVTHLTLSLAADLGPRKITVNCICPGAVATDFNAESRRANPAMDQAVLAVTAFKRWGEPQDIAEAVALIVSPQAAWITGQTIEVSGGLRL